MVKKAAGIKTGKQITLGVKKGDEQWSGNIPAVAKLIGVCSETIRRWNKAGETVVHKNGFEITFKFRRLKNE